MAEIKQIKVGDTVYDITANGVVEAVPNTLVQRDQWAGITVNHAIIQGNPENENDAINIKYLNGRTNTEDISNTIVQRDVNAGIKANHVIITGENQPENDTDATPKLYVDNQLNLKVDKTEVNVNAVSNTVVRRDQWAGITINHAIIQGNPENENDAVNIKYLKDHASVDNETFTNPVINEVHASDNFPDPTVWSGDDGFFYALSTSYGKHLFRSADLVTWTDCGYSPIDADTVSKLQAAGYNKIWAPSVHKIGPNWVMYLAGIHDTTSPKYSMIFTLTAKKCNGYFKLENALIGSPYTYLGNIRPIYNSGKEDCIDPFLDYDPYTNKLELYYGSTSGIFKTELTPDGLGVKYPNQQPTHVAGLTSSSNPTREKVFEGAYVYYQGDYKYLFASAGRAWTNDYKLVVGRAQKDTTNKTWTPFKDASGNLMTSGYATTLLKNTETTLLNGPGHCSAIFTDKLGRSYIFYHSHLNNAPTTSSNWQRATCLQQVRWINNFPSFAESTLSNGVYVDGKPQQTEVKPYLPSPQPNSIGVDHKLGTSITSDLQMTNIIDRFGTSLWIDVDIANIRGSIKITTSSGNFSAEYIGIYSNKHMTRKGSSLLLSSYGAMSLSNYLGMYSSEVEEEVSATIEIEDLTAL